MSREELEKRALEARYNLVSSKDKETIDILEELAIKALEQESMLDKIRAEIEQEYNKYRNMSEKWNERACGIGITLEIIDKYRKEN